MATKPARKSATKTADLKRSDSGTASLIIKPSTNVVSLLEEMKREVQGLAARTAPAGGDKIRVTQDKMFVLPDGRKSPGPIRLVIVDFVSVNNFYTNGYDPKKIEPPACFAIGMNPTTLVPSDRSPDMQAETCAVCPNNQFGSDGEGKACKNGRLLAVLAPDSQPDSPLMLIQVSPTALKGFDGYVKSVAAQFQVPPWGVTTEVSFDPNQTYASLLFAKPEPNTNLELFAPRREEARARLSQEPDVSQWKAAAPAPAKKAARR